MNATVGRMVHFYTQDKDEVLEGPQAAIVVGIVAQEPMDTPLGIAGRIDTVNLHVFPDRPLRPLSPRSGRCLFGDRVFEVRHANGDYFRENVMFSEEPNAGSWSWPPRAPEPTPPQQPPEKET
jgi:hypothetical protein